MDNINNFATKIASNIKDDNNKSYSFDPMFIIVIGSILLNTLKLLMMCNIFGKNLEDRIKNPSLLDKMLLKRSINKNITPEYKHLKDSISKEILANANNLSYEEIFKMVEEAKNAK